MRLNWRDVAHYDSAVRGFYAALPRRGLLRAAATTISILLPGEIASVGLCVNGSPTDIVYDPEVTLEDAGDVRRIVMRDHPAIFHRLRGPCAISDRVSRRTFQRTEMSGLMWQVSRAEDDIGVDTPLAPGVVLNGCIVRRWGRVTDRDRALLVLLRPHFAAAWRLVNAREAIERMHGAEWTQATGAGVIALDLSGRVQGWSDETRALVARCFGVKRGALRGLPDELKTWLARLRRPGLNNGVALAARVPLVKVAAGRRVEFHFLPDMAMGRNFVVVRPEGGAPVQPAGLTAREREVADGAARGLRNAEIAAELGVSPATVKRHLENVYAKLGTRGRMALAARLRGA